MVSCYRSTMNSWMRCVSLPQSHFLPSKWSTTIVHLRSCCLASVGVTYPGQPYLLLWWKGGTRGNSLNPPTFEREKLQISEYLTFMTASSQIAMPHQWLEGNLPVSAKCAVCDKTCGSVLRLQDWKCLWCKAMVGAMNRVQASRILPALLLAIIFILSFRSRAFGLSRSRQQVVQTQVSLTFVISHDLSYLLQLIFNTPTDAAFL